VASKAQTWRRVRLGVGPPKLHRGWARQPIVIGASRSCLSSTQARTVSARRRPRGLLRLQSFVLVQVGCTHRIFAHRLITQKKKSKLCADFPRRFQTKRVAFEVDGRGPVAHVSHHRGPGRPAGRGLVTTCAHQPGRKASYDGSSHREGERMDARAHLLFLFQTRRATTRAKLQHLLESACPVLNRPPCRAERRERKKRERGRRQRRRRGSPVMGGYWLVQQGSAWCVLYVVPALGPPTRSFPARSFQRLLRRRPPQVTSSRRPESDRPGDDEPGHSSV
jgi:hypothetical protein